MVPETVDHPYLRTLVTLFGAWLHETTPPVPHEWGLLAAPPSVLLALWVALTRSVPRQHRLWMCWEPPRTTWTISPVRQTLHRTVTAFGLLRNWPKPLITYLEDTVLLPHWPEAPTLLTTWLEDVWQHPGAGAESL